MVRKKLQVQHKMPSFLRSGELGFVACYFYKGNIDSVSNVSIFLKLYCNK